MNLSKESTTDQPARTADFPADPELVHPDAEQLRLHYHAFARTDADVMPLGNGTMTANIGFFAPGYIEFPLARADAWDEHHRLIKLDKIRVTFADGLRAEGWSQTLDPFTGTMIFSGSSLKGEPVRGTAWIDRFHPTLVIKVETPGELIISRQNWRNRTRAFLPGEDHYADHYIQSAEILPDIEVPTADGITWYHHNTCSPFDDNLRLQGLREAADATGLQDPILNRITGATIHGDSIRSVADGTLVSEGPAHRILITSHTAHPSTPDAWLAEISALREESAMWDLEGRHRQHRAWWIEKFNRSWIVLRGPDEADAITRGYLYQRYLLLCAASGNAPVKFNGSLFTCDPHHDGSHMRGEEVRAYSPDFRLWGGCYWFQNTRLPYWAMLPGGDHEMFAPFFALHTANPAFARERTRIHHGHGGIYFPETTTLWGTYSTFCFGRNRQGKNPQDPVENEWIRHHYNCTLEMLFLMLSWEKHTRDETAWKEMILPYASEVLAWWQFHWPRDHEGRLQVFPAYACETYRDVSNPACDIAGLQACLDSLLDQPGRLPRNLLEEWRYLRGILPALPKNSETLLPCEPPVPGACNSENPECYAIFPYQIYRLGAQEDLALARRTFESRLFRDQSGWQQSGIFAAMLGDHETALEDLRVRVANRHQDSWFPAFWGANYDWAPDQDHGCCFMLTLQAMVLQAWPDKDLVLPCFPKDGPWRVHFKLHSTRGPVTSSC